MADSSKKITAKTTQAILLVFTLAFPGLRASAQTAPPNASSTNTSSELLQQLHTKFQKLEPQTISPSAGVIRHDYLIPAGYYRQMWDWDGFFIGMHFAHQGPAQAIYLKWWAQNFAQSVDADGYVSGCITPKGPRPLFGKFAMKPFLAQGAYFAASRLNDYTWVAPIWDKLQLVLAYRDRTQYDPKYGLYFWDNAMQSGGDNNAALTNDPADRSSILAVDASLFQYREFRAMEALALHLHRPQQAHEYQAKAEHLRAAMLHYLWSPTDAMFWNIRRDTGAQVRHISYSNFFPLIDDILPAADARRMIQLHLLNPDEMRSPHGFRSLAKSDPEYNNSATIVPYSNWRGPLWINANYLDYIALRRYGFPTQAHWVADSLAKSVIADIEKWGSMHEDYDPETGLGLAPTVADSPNHVFAGFVGWNLLTEDMLQCEVDQRCMMFEIQTPPSSPSSASH